VTDFLLDNWLTIIDSLDASTLTRAKYKADAKTFLQFVQDKGIYLNIYRDYKKHLQTTTNISTKTKNYKLVAAKRLLVELYSHYRIMSVDVTAGVKGFKVSQEHTKDGLTSSEVTAVRCCIDAMPHDRKRIRLQAFFALLTYQGLRQFEVCNLTADDLLLADGQIKIQGKGRDDKEVIDLHPRTTAALLLYVKTFSVKSGYLFTSLSNNKKDKLSERSVRRLFADVFACAGLSAARSVHGFRHYFVTTLLESKSFDLLEVSKFSRHKSIVTLQKYDDRRQKRELLPAFYNVFN
jgi:site-specific recombinase XerD